MHLYSASQNAFYSTEIHEVFPKDCKELTDEQYAAILAGMSENEVHPGKDGMPTLVPRPQPSAVDIAKAERAKAVNNIVVTTASGRTFDGDEVSQGRMTRSLAVLAPGESIEWVLADNTVAQVSREELHEALRLAGVEQARLWVEPYQGV